MTGVSGNNREVTAFGISSYDSNSMKSGNPHSGVYKTETIKTLDNNGGNPACNQGGVCVIEGNGTRESHKGAGFKISETSYTLNTVEQHAVAVDVFNQTVTGDTACSFTAAGGGATQPAPKC